MADVVSIDDAYVWSVSRIAEAFGMDRRTVSKKIKESAVRPFGSRRGSPVYLLRDIGPVLFGPAAHGDPEGGFNDPGCMLPVDRKAWYDSEKSRLAVEKEMGRLIPVEDHARSLAEIVKGIVNPLDTLIDDLESKVALDWRALEVCQRVIDACREQMYLNAINSGAELDGEAADE